MKTKWVYSFGDGAADGSAVLRNLLGGKGANLAEMASLGLPVPPGFTITTDLCTAYYANGEAYPDDLKGQVEEALAQVEIITGAKFSDPVQPLLVSVRSGARVSMPGMMDTVLNLGLNDATVAGLAKASGDERFAWDSYRRFIQMYSDVVLGVEQFEFEDLLETLKRGEGYILDTELLADDWKTLVSSYKEKVEELLDAPFPQDPTEQLWGAVNAVFGSWMNQRASTYRNLHDISHDWGTAVNIQAMVFGNMGDDCATGVAFTRDPSTGENAFYGEYLVNAQGEDVVAGIRTPLPLTIAGKASGGSEMPSMEEIMPEVFGQLMEVRSNLESHFRDVQDIEFTVQKGKLWMLQTRTGKRTAKAALRIACDMVDEGLITEAEAVARIEPESLDQLLHPTLDPDAKRHVVARGLPASPGAASGKIVFSSDAAEKLAGQGEDVILVRIETSPEDIHGMHAANGILTSRGGMTSHAAVVARGMGTPCVAGASELHIDYATQSLIAREENIKSGDVITIDGASGEVMLGRLPTLTAELSDDFGRIMEWVDRIRTLGVRANAETPEDTRTAIRLGAEGIGLSRTEHMFFDAQRIIAVREMILASDVENRRAALTKLLPMQREDFIELFRIMEGRPITIRLLDPPLHEFLPHTETDVAGVAEALGSDTETVRIRINALSEANPMLGHRGCRLAITYPELPEMQARAIFEAAAHVVKHDNIAVLPEVMIPLIATKREFDILKEIVDRVAAEVIAAEGTSFPFLVGTMIELPRACLRAGDIAETAEFFSFGTNDLTQTAFGLSRDDAGSFLADYETAGIFERDPFVTIDEGGVGELMKIGCERGLATRPDLKLGICGEHGGDPTSVAFCHKVGLNYVSCSPYRVPIARLAAAQAALVEK